ncbi:hypothetical protein PISL3812_02863 [Talaromyces islandicus]|uniref:Chalcone isomerase domain-containing protein n=1 Tax=Talaromyces islandicus TaxID=28573 RepID=A0A0U1LTE0_TALIS|nr:hypothetical protein PISL3812_02863 [Talaromyces islandicus]
MRTRTLPLSICRQCLGRQRQRQQLSAARFFSATRRASSTTTTAAAGNNPLRSASAEELKSQSEAIAHFRRRMALSAAGIAVCAIGLYATVKTNAFGLPDDAASSNNNNKKDEQGNSNSNGSIKLDGPAGFPSSPSVIRIQGQDGVEQVETGNSSVPLFPTTVRLPKTLNAATLAPGQDIPRTATEDDDEEYQLLGLGIRTVSFLAIQVYVVGLYIAKSDIAALQQSLVKTGVQPPSEHMAKNGVVAATSLVSTEREALKNLLLDPERGEEAWTSILKESNIRTAVRIVPTRNTDFMHLRDAWVRHMTNRAQREAAQIKEIAKTGEKPPPAGEFQDDSFGQSVGEFKTLLSGGGGGRKTIPKGQVLFLLRDQRGALDALFQPEPENAIKWLGRIEDERVSRCVWLNYLAGKTVASDAARKSIVEGTMAIVERPVGTVIQKVI